MSKTKCTVCGEKIDERDARFIIVDGVKYGKRMELVYTLCPGCDIKFKPIDVKGLWP